MRGKALSRLNAARLIIAKETEPGADTPKRETHCYAQGEPNRQFEEFVNIITSGKFIEPRRG